MPTIIVIKFETFNILVGKISIEHVSVENHKMISQKIFASVFVHVFACVWYVCVCVLFKSQCKRYIDEILVKSP